MPAELLAQHVHRQRTGNVGGRGHHRRGSQGMGHLLGQLVGAAQVAGQEAYRETPGIIHAHHGGVGVLVRQVGRQQPHRRAYRHQQHQLFVLFENLFYYRTRRQVKGHGIIGVRQQPSFQVQGRAAAQRGCQRTSQVRTPARYRNYGGAGHGTCDLTVHRWRRGWPGQRLAWTVPGGRGGYSLRNRGGRSTHPGAGRRRGSTGPGPRPGPL